VKDFDMLSLDKIIDGYSLPLSSEWYGVWKYSLSVLFGLTLLGLLFTTTCLESQLILFASWVVL
jgi:hypothetical protein